MRVGWKGLKRVYYIVLHFDIKEDKIWLQHNATGIDAGEELVSLGVPKQDIVLGLHPPYKRPYTGYGVAESTRFICHQKEQYPNKYKSILQTFGKSVLYLLSHFVDKLLHPTRLQNFPVHLQQG